MSTRRWLPALSEQCTVCCPSLGGIRAVDKPQFACPCTTEGHVCRFQLLVIMNNVAINSHAQVFA